ncbi:hypothetical protein DMX12_12385 [Pseudomonas sp. MB-090624]|nr:hypothetical protein DMX12_12385 [Pseudomonas sp. MB-090624]
MAGCWLPRTTMPATGAMAKLVVEGLAGMIQASGKEVLWRIAVNPRLGNSGRQCEVSRPVRG